MAASTDSIQSGVYIALEPNNPNSAGFFAINGETPRRCDSITSVPNGVLVISNFDFNCYRLLSSTKNLRPAWYLGRAPHAICADLGAPFAENKNYAASLAQSSSRIYSRTLQFISRSYHWGQSRPFFHDTVAQDLQEMMGIGGFKNLVPAVEPQAFIAAYQSDSVVTGLAEPDVFYHHVTLRKNQVEHAEHICSLPLPDPMQWRRAEDGELGETDEQRIRWVLESEAPILAEVELSDFREEAISKLISFGVSMGNQAFKLGTVKTHATDAEICWLVQFCRVKIRSALIGGRYKPLLPKYKIPPALVEDPLLKLSYSAGLAAFNHFQALSSKTYNRNAQAGQMKYNHSVRNVWMKAYDRGVMFNYALRAHKQGFAVTGYGSGGLRLAFKKEDLPKVMEFAIEQEFYAPNFHLLASSLGFKSNLGDTELDYELDETYSNE